ncbi:MAG: hypothetical protein JSU05_02030 [Bacteroidetes bacterium]|nr:hypothetical protein [Bacteroidota bacterium]
MKRRIRKIVNFFAFNLLFFALYLNFIHKDKVVADASPVTHTNGAAYSGAAVLVQNPEKYLMKKETVANQQVPVAEEKTTTSSAN